MAEDDIPGANSLLRNDLRRCAVNLLRVRHARRRYLQGLLLGPAWDLMVALYGHESAICTVGELAKLADLPLTTTSRHIQHLEKEGLLRRAERKTDARMVEVHLTDQGRNAAETILAEAIL